MNHLRLTLATLAALVMVLLCACSNENAPVRGFVLPEGDPGQGQLVFEKYKCYACHTISGIEFPEMEFEAPFMLDIGGEVYRVRDYGELLTAVVNPEHIISPKYQGMLRRAGREPSGSPMPYRGGEMTVQELIDLVTFLHQQYTLLQPRYYRGFYLTK